MFLSDLSIKRPVAISMFLVVFVLFGAMAYFGMNLELMPESDLPMITVRTIYPGASPEDLEAQVTRKIENEVASVNKIDYIHSYSLENVSYVMIAFTMDKDVNIAQQEIKDKVEGIINDLPQNVEHPVVQRFDPLVKPAVELVLSGSRPATELYEFADKQLSASFGQIDGVAHLNLSGGQEREIRVELDSGTAHRYNISLAQLAAILAAQNLNVPSGSFQRRDQDYSVRLKGEFEDLQTIRGLEIPTAHGNKRLDDLALIYDTGKEVRERATYFNNMKKTGDDDVILLSLMKASDGNEVNIYRAVEKILPEIKQSLPTGCSLEVVNESATFTQAAVNDTLLNILFAIILTSLILLFFLHDYKSTIIVAVSMPMSIICALLFMKLSGFTLNLLSLSGLTVSVGILVANAVVVLENIFRYKNRGLPPRESASLGTSEITMAVLASAGTNLVVFLPLATMSLSIVGKFLVQFSLSVVFATIFSIIISLTLTPMMASRIPPDQNEKRHPLGDRFERMFQSWERGYHRLLKFLLGNKKRGIPVLLLSIILLALSILLAGTIGFEFIPSPDEGTIGVKVELPAGYRLEETAAVMKEIESRLKSYDEVAHFWTQLGHQDEMNVGTNLAYLKIKLTNDDVRISSSDQIIQTMITDFSDIPNARIAISSIKSLYSGISDIMFTIKGFDPGAQDDIRRRLNPRLKAVPGFINLDSGSGSGKPEVTLSPDRHKLIEAGLSVHDLALALRSGLDGLVASSLKDRGEEHDIRLCLQKASVDSPEEVGAIPVTGPRGTYRIDQLAEMTFSEGFSTIFRKDRAQAIQFSGDVGFGHVMGDVMDGIEAAVKDVGLPPGCKLEWGGMSEEMDSTFRDLSRAFIIAIVLTYMLLAAILESLIQPLLILGTVPLALIGVFAALAAAGLSINMISMLAIVMLIGIVVNDAILIVDYTNQLVREKGLSIHDALLEAGPARLKSIIMTTMAIIMGMTPMALGLGSSAVELRQSLGVVSIGGMFACTPLTLLVVPILTNMASKRNKNVGSHANNAGEL